MKGLKDRVIILRDNFRLIFVLTIVTIVSGAVLALTYGFANPKIEEIRAEERKASLGEVVPEAVQFDVLEMDPSMGFYKETEVYIGYDAEGNLKGYAFLLNTGGFQGEISMMIGVDGSGLHITGLRVLEHLETPGLGSRITEPIFEGQFKGKPLTNEFRLSTDIDSITGATISAQAVAEGVREGTSWFIQVYKELIEER